MSFIKKLFGGTFETNRDEGDALFAKQCFGEALLAYERACDKARGVPEERTSEVAAVRAQVHTCRLELARARIAEADTFTSEGDTPRALECLQEAAEICDDPEISATIIGRTQQYEAEEVRQAAGDAEEMTEDELLAVIAGTWTEAQADEYAQLPDAFREALLARYDRDHERSLELLEQVLNAPDLQIRPRYAFLELAGALSASDRGEEALAAFDRFLSEVDGDDDAAELITGALTSKGQVLLALGRPGQAAEQLEAATRASPSSHIAYLNLGTFLRSRGEHERSLQALHTAAELMGQLHPDFRVIREMGLTYLALGRKREAEETLYAAIEHHASRGTHDQIDPIAAVALAKIYEEHDEFRKASDLFRHLAQGYDTANHFTYNLEAARLLRLDDAEPALVKRYLTRAAELASRDEDLERLAQMRSGEVG